MWCIKASHLIYGGCGTFLKTENMKRVACFVLTLHFQFTPLSYRQCFTIHVHYSGACDGTCPPFFALSLNVLALVVVARWQYFENRRARRTETTDKHTHKFISRLEFVPLILSFVYVKSLEMCVLDENIMRKRRKLILVRLFCKRWDKFILSWSVTRIHKAKLSKRIKNTFFPSKCTRKLLKSASKKTH